MRFLSYVTLCLVVWAGPGALAAGYASAQAAPPSPEASASQSSSHDGQHDFDFAIGTWKLHMSRLIHPLSGSKTWVTMEGTKVVRKVWGGRAAIEEVEANGQIGHYESMGLFLYNPEAHQWNVSFAQSTDGTLSVPAVGEFKLGQGEFYDQEPYKGRAILVRFVWSDIRPTSHRLEQAFSEDGGKTWETNLIVNLTRAPDSTPARTGFVSPETIPDTRAAP